MKTEKIINQLPSLLLFAAFVLTLAIGVVMFTGSALKLYVFNINSPYTDDYSWKCDRLLPYSANKIPINYEAGDKKTNLSPEEKKEMEAKYEKCLENAKKEAKERYINSLYSTMADGLSFIISSLLFAVFYFVFFFRKRLEKEG